MQTIQILPFMLAGVLSAQVTNPTHTPVSGSPQSGPSPIYRVQVIDRTAPAVNYERRASTKIDFKGTVLQADSHGEARVENRKGAVRIEAKFEGLEPPTRYGRQYLTYVLWAVTPEGRATNLGQIIADDENKAKVRVSTELQTFALIVTAEPYYIVSQPSDVVVMENAVRPDTRGRIEVVDATYELLPRGEFQYSVNPASGVAAGEKVSLDRYEAILELYQARNAVQFARSSGADERAAEILKKAENLLAEAEDLHARKADPKSILSIARQATQTAEDARIVAIRRAAPEAGRLAGVSQND